MVTPGSPGCIEFVLRGGAEKAVAEGEAEEDDGAAGQHGGAGLFAEEESDPDRVEDRLDEGEEAGLGAADALQAAGEQHVGDRELDGRHQGEQTEVAETDVPDARN